MKNLTQKQKEEISSKLQEFGFVLSVHIDKGIAGHVFSAHSVVSGQEVAVKIIDKSEILQEHINRELKIASCLRHQHIIQTLNVYQTLNFAYIEMTRMNYNLFDYVSDNGALPEKLSRSLFAQLILAVDYMHNTVRMAHGGITCNNILLDDKLNLKLADFCQSRQLSSEDKNEVASRKKWRNPHYKGPEFTTGEHFDPVRADIFSLGIVLFYMLRKTFPQRNADYEVVYVREMTNLPGYLLCHQLLINLLHPNPVLRFTTEEILRHHWLKEEPSLRSRIEAFLFLFVYTKESLVQNRKRQNGSSRVKDGKGRQKRHSKIGQAQRTPEKTARKISAASDIDLQLSEEDQFAEPSPSFVKEQPASVTGPKKPTKNRKWGIRIS